jgi:DNA-binding MarR family transcriptional regulator
MPTYLSKHVPTTSGPEDQPLGYLLYRVGTILQPATNATLRRFGLTLAEFVCMKILSGHPGLSNAELARVSNVSPQAMNNVLKNLQAMGLVTRPASVSSGRSLPAQLTGQGKTLLKRADAAAAATEDTVLAKLTATQRRQLKRMLATIGASASATPESQAAF